MREEKYKEILYDEILVDCKGEYEQNMSWYYFVQDELEYPFDAFIEIRKREGGKVSKKIKVVDLSTEDSNFDKNFDLKVDVEFDDFILEIPLGKLEKIEASERIVEIIEVWNYWIKK